MTARFEDDACKCGHARRQHATSDPNHCAVCPEGRCDGFIWDRSRGWLLLVRAAELAHRTGAHVKLDRLAASAAANGDQFMAGWRLEIRTVDDFDLAAPTGVDETMELAELTANRWFERMRDAPAGTPPGGVCGWCGVLDGQWCKPIHDGERLPGGWSHPGRGQHQSDVVEWARSVILGRQEDLLPGMREHAEVRRDARVAIRKVADEIVALAHINEAMSLASKRPALHPGAGTGIDFRGVDRGVRGVVDLIISATIDGQMSELSTRVAADAPSTSVAFHAADGSLTTPNELTVLRLSNGTQVAGCGWLTAIPMSTTGVTHDVCVRPRSVGGPWCPTHNAALATGYNRPPPTSTPGPGQKVSR